MKKKKTKKENSILSSPGPPNPKMCFRGLLCFKGNTLIENLPKRPNNNDFGCIAQIFVVPPYPL